MKKSQGGILFWNWIIIAGSFGFVAVLFVSAYWEADIRLLHFFQAWMYIATAVLCAKGNRWGYFLGIAIAAFWNYVNLFVTNFLHAGIEQLLGFLNTGHIVRLDLLISVPAWTTNLVVLTACMYGYSRQAHKAWNDLGKFAIAAILSTTYFALIMALCQPRYLAIFPRLVHPHLNL